MQHQFLFLAATMHTLGVRARDRVREATAGERGAGPVESAITIGTLVVAALAVAALITAAVAKYSGNIK